MSDFIGSLDHPTSLLCIERFLNQLLSHNNILVFHYNNHYNSIKVFHQHVEIIDFKRKST